MSVKKIYPVPSQLILLKCLRRQMRALLSEQMTVFINFKAKTSWVSARYQNRLIDLQRPKRLIVLGNSPIFSREIIEVLMILQLYTSMTKRNQQTNLPCGCSDTRHNIKSLKFQIHNLHRFLKLNQGSSIVTTNQVSSSMGLKMVLTNNQMLNSCKPSTASAEMKFQWAPIR